MRIHEFWFGFPKNRKLDAAYERKYDGSIIFFSGTRVYRFTGTKLAPGYPKDLSEEFIIPKNTKIPKRIDGGNDFIIIVTPGVTGIPCCHYEFPNKKLTT